MSNDRLGEINYNNRGHTKMVIVKYNSPTDVIVEFQDEYKTKVKSTYYNFTHGAIRNPYDKTVYNVGYMGVGKYSKKHNSAYIHWNTMLQRCYDIKFQEKHPNYIGCTVCEEWHNFQNFAEWYYENYYEIKGQRMEIENNILMKNNKEYCPEYTIISPQRINTLFVKRDRDRGECCIGVTFNKRRRKYIGQCSYIDENGEYKRISKAFDTEEDAFYFYKDIKEKYIKQVADEYEDLIPRELYKAMYEYEVEIDD